MSKTTPAPRGLSARQLAALRGNSFGVLAMLIVQFAIGSWVNLYAKVPAADRNSGVFGAVGHALTDGPASLAAHAGLGLLIVLAALALAVRSVMARHVVAATASVIGLLAIVSAAINGARFVSDGGQAGASLAMALATAAAMLCYALSLLVLSFARPAAEAQAPDEAPALDPQRPGTPAPRP